LEPTSEPHIIRLLAADIAEGRCLPFVGAGFSINADLPHGLTMPTWRELAETLASIAGIDPHLSPPAVASQFAKRFGRVQLIEAIRQALHTDVATPGRAHDAFAMLPFDTVYTTNFDTLLEDAYHSLKAPYKALVGEHQMPFHGGKGRTTIVKMHGDVRHQEYIVVSTEDYVSYLDRYPLVATHLSAMLITRTPLFIGYSLSDPNFLSIQRVVESRLGEFVRMAYALQFGDARDVAEDSLGENVHIIRLKGSNRAERTNAVANFLETLLMAIDAKSAGKMRSNEPALFEPIDAGKIEQAISSKDASTVLSASAKFCFVAIPFAPEASSVYRSAIVPAIESVGLMPLRSDELSSIGSMIEQTRSAIQQARVVIADVTGGTRGVAHEVGLARGFGQPVILIARKGAQVPVDLRHMLVLRYDPDDLDEFAHQLSRALTSPLGDDRLSEARTLIHDGQYQAAILILASVLEQSLSETLVQQTRGGPVGARPAWRSLGALSETVVREGVIPKDLIPKLMEAVQIRNAAAHHTSESSREAAELMLRVVESARGRLGSR